ncbi:thioredoxin [Nannizzia gypsea CBS 118893]|uniref:Thioredoxin n=1 Tax=Arthroderma gypseum (strain ATCC MYA-4604 / CBS 118893) TaxID=535722 RepID=E4V2Q9_ARTGP|nr:thioredoxin [Nannizzia gypsea CBS 118893]EFR03621.1 thioredoxin [Nannizzia gypsea CBS 118893]
MGVPAIEGLAKFNEIINSGKVVAIDFWATWCGPCRTISPVFETLSTKHTDIEFYKVDVDAEADIAQEVGIRAMPTFIIFKDGMKQGELVGANPQHLEAMLHKASL